MASHRAALPDAASVLSPWRLHVEAERLIAADWCDDHGWHAAARSLRDTQRAVRCSGDWLERMAKVGAAFAVMQTAAAVVRYNAHATGQDLWTGDAGPLCHEAAVHASPRGVPSSQAWSLALGPHSIAVWACSYSELLDTVNRWVEIVWSQNPYLHVLMKRRPARR